MHALFRSLDRDDGVSGVALPQVWQAFTGAKVKMFPGDLIMWAGPPGSGKSTLALNYMIAAKVPTLYISSDMPPFLVSKRMCSIATQTDQDIVEEELKTPEGRLKYSRVLQDLSHIYVDYPARPDAESIARSQMAFMEIHGTPSPLMIVDNLMNLDSGNDNEWAGLRELSQVLKYFVNELQITIIVLHHTTLSGYSGYPGPESSIMGKVVELPATILTIASRPGEMLIAPVKNRHGPADDSGKTYVPLAFDGPTQVISDKKPEIQTVSAGAYASSGSRQSDWRERAFKNDD